MRRAYHPIWGGQIAKAIAPWGGSGGPLPHKGGGPSKLAAIPPPLSDQMEKVILYLFASLQNAHEYLFCDVEKQCIEVP